VVEPGAQAATELSAQKRIGVLATRGTLQSGFYPRAIKSYEPAAEVFIYAAPLLVPLAEEGWHQGEITENIISHYLQTMLQHPIDCLLLGCTHYPLFIPVIKQLLPSNIALVDSATTTAQATKQFLETHACQNAQNHEGQTRFFVTDDPEQFTRVGSVFLGHSIVPEKVTLVDL
jgi:glutamate racemase